MLMQTREIQDKQVLQLCVCNALLCNPRLSYIFTAFNNKLKHLGKTTELEYDKNEQIKLNNRL